MKPKKKKRHLSAKHKKTKAAIYRYILDRALDLGLIIILEFVLVAHHNKCMWNSQLW